MKNSGGDIYKEYLKTYINDSSIILDAGCGAGDWFIADYRNKAKKIIGIDVDKELLEQNAIADEKICADLENIPLDDDSVDVIISTFVIEHLKQPDVVFSEFSRFLKPGGVFIFITSNIYNPVMLLSKILPLSIHKLLRRNILKKEEESYKTYYFANTYGELKKLAHEHGFKCKDIKRAGNPGYFSFWRPLEIMVQQCERMIDNKYLCFLKMYLIGCFIKK